MRLAAVSVALLTIGLFSSCSNKPSTETPAPSADAAPPAETAPAPEPPSGPRAVVHLKNGNKVPGSIVASTRTEMVVMGDDGIETKVPLGQVKSVEYGEGETTSAAARPRTSPTPRPAAPAARETPAPKQEPARTEEKAASTPPPAPAERDLTPAPPPRQVTTKTYELPAGSQISVRTNEAIDSSTAAEGQGYDAQVTRDAKDANGDIVIPRGADARIVIRSASRGGRIKGASDLVLDLESVTINGKRYDINTVDVTKQGKSGVGANRRTAEHVGGGAALGAIIGAIAGGGKGAAIGAGAGAGAGALAQILTKGRTIKVPVESVLTFSLDQSLKVSQVN